MKDDILCFELPYVEEEFTKAETFELMSLSGDKYSKTTQIMGTNMAFRCSLKTKNFVKEWLDFCCDFNVISPDFDPAKQVRTFFLIEKINQYLACYVKSMVFSLFQNPHFGAGLATPIFMN